jgi:hypothetical protein
MISVLEMQLIKGKNKRINEQMNEEVRKLLPIAYCLLPAFKPSGMGHGRAER